ncbi:endoribonuclease L-PSP [Paenibacillus sp. TCA20]|uniref:RidA family protein n=1 Tax=Paenibacillus urinalis TaxID=521520 RepID=A0AAX3N4U2_9BACL|nr:MULTISPECIES: RidA family protein [Paenibacillus]WDH84049.1 RidA family protein [Paenibacillus urinalis]GAK38968.1 endoribonuclease L-PSP [Paenibacillus sp. TCA20]
MKHLSYIEGLAVYMSQLQTTEERLQDLGIELPAASNPAAQYTNVVIVNGLMFVSGKGPSGSPKGKLGSDFTTEEGYTFARDAAIEVLAVVRDALGTLDRVKRVVKVQGFVNAEPSFEEHHKVLNGYSDLMSDVFGEKGVHARSVFGAVSVRDNLPIIVDSIFQVEEE